MNNLYAEKEKGWRTRAAPGEGGVAGAAIQPVCGVERGSDKTTLWVPSRHALIQGSAARGLPARGPHKSPAQGTASGPLTVA